MLYPSTRDNISPNTVVAVLGKPETIIAFLEYLLFFDMAKLKSDTKERLYQESISEVQNWYLENIKLENQTEDDVFTKFGRSIGFIGEKKESQRLYIKNIDSQLDEYREAVNQIRLLNTRVGSYSRSKWLVDKGIARSFALINLFGERGNLFDRNFRIVCDVLYKNFKNWNFCGFYGYDWSGIINRRRKGDKLEILVYKSDKIPCSPINMSGVCGKSLKSDKTIIVPDVNQFRGHIECDPNSKSEIVIPFSNNYVFDVDSKKLDDFDEIDEKYLKKIIKTIYLLSASNPTSSET